MQATLKETEKPLYSLKKINIIVKIGLSRKNVHYISKNLSRTPLFVYMKAARSAVFKC